MKVSFTGGYLCGTSRYECSAEPIVMSNCHYRDNEQRVAHLRQRFWFRGVPSRSLKRLNITKRSAIKAGRFEEGDEK